MTLANAARGDALLPIDGAPVRLRLTLGALAQLETAFDADGLAALESRLTRLGARDLLVVLAALIEGGGGETSVEALARAAVDPAQAARAVALAFERAFA